MAFALSPGGTHEYPRCNHRGGDDCLHPFQRESCRRSRGNRASRRTCLTSPRDYTPPGTRWRYRIERSTGRHCWFLKDEAEKAARKAPEQVTADAEEPVAATPRRKPAAPRALSDARAELVANASRAGCHQAGARRWRIRSGGTHCRAQPSAHEIRQHAGAGTGGTLAGFDVGGEPAAPVRRRLRPSRARKYNRRPQPRRPSRRSCRAPCRRCPHPKSRCRCRC